MLHRRSIKWDAAFQKGANKEKEVNLVPGERKFKVPVWSHREKVSKNLVLSNVSKYQDTVNLKMMKHGSILLR